MLCFGVRRCIFLLFTLAIVFFCYFYTALVFNPKDVADNLKKSGAYIPGIRPGEQSARYIDTVMGRLTLIGSVYMSLVCFLPLGLQGVWQRAFLSGRHLPADCSGGSDGLLVAG